jgi:polyisoprenoid-binding protein YceI
MRKLFLLLFLCAAQFTLFAQNSIYSTTSGEINFFSKAPLEDIDAKNNQAVSLLNTSNNEIVVRVPMRGFQFRNKLMQEHFNENYMESERFTHATFKGKVNETIDYQKAGTYDVSATGILNIHGVNQKRTLKGKLTISDNAMSLITNFNVMLVDHKIKVPTLVFNKIAETIAVSTTFNYSPYKK